MDAQKLALVLAGLGLTGSSACKKGETDATTVPEAAGVASHSGAQGEGEHTCGNHADGACGADTQDATAAPSSKGFEIEPGKFAELNMKMRAGATVTARFSRAGHELSWNVHSHAHDGGTKIHDEGTGAEGEVQFTAPEDGVFSILWKNEADAATRLAGHRKTGFVDEAGFHDGFFHERGELVFLWSRDSVGGALPADAPSLHR